ncbi:hypothetical protein I546_5930 [Mycobacterium kansasii 732]|nr:hypothetical protein I546_5930 [Mycobacterium kansasii 732]
MRSPRGDTGAEARSHEGCPVGAAGRNVGFLISHISHRRL